ncbi:MAG: HAMP domain-containing histidine kinase [Clostridia bacterium]|nr:HAMP domain-containing histidine kinase [Clostridia bacterium]
MKLKIKNISTKYMLIFMTVIVVTVLIMGIIITAIVSSFSLDTKMKSMYDSNKLLGSFLDETGKDKDLRSLLMENEESLDKMLDIIFLTSPYCDITVYDLEGRLIFFASLNDESEKEKYFDDTSKLPSVIREENLPKELLDELHEEETEGTISRSDVCYGYFQREVVYYTSLIQNNKGENIGIAMTYDRGDEEGDLIFDMLLAIIVTVIWISIAAMVAIYGVSQRTMRPLREIGQAAKSFSQGNFDVRVKVRGDDELAELAQSFNKMASELQAKDEMQKNFLSNVSHDLRTPMTTIAGFIDGILDGAIPPQKQDYYLNIIKNEIKRLNRLVSSLLDISRLQSGERKFDKKPFNICELARQTIISFENQLYEKELDVEFNCDEDDMIAMGDKDAINQVIYNLCHNAIKFSYDKGKYHVNICYKDDKVQFTMFNEGIGIASEDLPYVFDRFYKSDKSRGLDKTGVGLGLFITRTIIESHGEKISAESEYGKNCSFTFTLPRGE